MARADGAGFPAGRAVGEIAAGGGNYLVLSISATATGVDIECMSGGELRSRLKRASIRWPQLPAVAVVAVYITAYASWQVFRWGGPDAKELIGDLLVTVFYGSAALVVWTVARRCSGTPAGPAWRLLAIGLSFYWIGSVLQAYYEVIAASKPYPSLADPSYLMFYPFAFAALLRFPRAGGLRVQRFETLIDCATVAIAGGAVVWYVLLGPATLAHGTLLQTLVTIGFPVGDLILIAALAPVLLRRPLPGSATALRIAAAGFTFIVAADLVYGSLSLKGAYSGGDPVDGLYLVAVGLLGIAACAQRDESDTDELDHPSAVRRATWLPWLGVALVFGLLAVATRESPLVPVGGLLVSAAVATFLVALRQLAAQRELLSTHRELELAHAELAALALTDPVTLVPNHRALMSSINQELARCVRGAARCALVFIDIDHFKAFNDRFGHAAGDAALREFSAVAGSGLRRADTFGRWGGEEFVAILPEVDATDAMVVAERVRKAVAGHHFKAGQSGHLTCSLGVAASPGDGGTRAELIEAADRAMYAAKRLGRNQTLSAADPVVSALGAEKTSDVSRSSEALTDAVSALAMLVDARDGSTDAHASVVADLARRISVELGCGDDEAATIGAGARLHDIGKIAIPDAILAKPGPLTETERAVMQTHPVVGAEVLARVPALRAIVPLVRSHHERWDGTGYPDGLIAEETPLGARIISVADAFDAMVSERPYSEAMTPDAALAELSAGAGTQFDTRVVEVMERMLRTRNASREAALV